MRKTPKRRPGIATQNGEHHRSARDATHHRSASQGCSRCTQWSVKHASVGSETRKREPAYPLGRVLEAVEADGDGRDLLMVSQYMYAAPSHSMCATGIPCPQLTASVCMPHQVICCPFSVPIGEQLPRLLHLGRVLEAVEADGDGRDLLVRLIVILREPPHQVPVPQNPLPHNTTENRWSFAAWKAQLLVCAVVGGSSPKHMTWWCIQSLEKRRAAPIPLRYRCRARRSRTAR
jgi:hypothetical protein